MLHKALVSVLWPDSNFIICFDPNNYSGRHSGTKQKEFEVCGRSKLKFINEARQLHKYWPTFIDRGLS